MQIGEKQYPDGTSAFGVLPLPMLSPQQQDSLSKKELEVLHLMLRGYTNSEISKQLGKSFETVKIQVSKCLKKLGVATRKELIAKYQTPNAEVRGCANTKGETE